MRVQDTKAQQQGRKGGGMAAGHPLGLDPPQRYRGGLEEDGPASYEDDFEDDDGGQEGRGAMGGLQHHHKRTGSSYSTTTYPEEEEAYEGEEEGGGGMGGRDEEEEESQLFVDEERLQRAIVHQTRHNLPSGLGDLVGEAVRRRAAEVGGGGAAASLEGSGGSFSPIMSGERPRLHDGWW